MILLWNASDNLYLSVSVGVFPAFIHMDDRNVQQTLKGSDFSEPYQEKSNAMNMST